MNEKSLKRLAVLCLSMALLSVFMACFRAGAQQTSNPTISITEIPHSGEGGPVGMLPIAGAATGVDFGKYRVVVYARAGNDVWYVQPFVADPYTELDRYGKWQTDTHLGRVYAALLVEASFVPPAIAYSLPGGGDVVAVARVPGKD